MVSRMVDLFMKEEDDRFFKTTIWPEWLVGLFGSVEAIERLPLHHLDPEMTHRDYIDYVGPDEFPTPFVSGVAVHDKFSKRPFVIFKVLNRNSGEIKAIALFQRYIGRNMWCCGSLRDFGSSSDCLGESIVSHGRGLDNLKLLFADRHPSWELVGN